MVLASSILLTLAVPTLPLSGTYEVAMMRPGSKVVEHQSANTSAGAVRHMVLANGRFAMFDTMSAFSGTVEAAGKVVTVTITDNPSGKMKSPEILTFDASADGKTLMGRPKSAGDRRVVFIWQTTKLLVPPTKFVGK